jgi:hypothetical protein
VHNAWDIMCTAIDVDCEYTIHILQFDYSSIRVQKLDIFIHIHIPCGCADDRRMEVSITLKRREVG